MITYPTNLPTPDFGSYYGVVDEGLIRTSFPVPAPTQVVWFNSPTVNITMTFSMDNATWLEWSEFASSYGYDWFLMPIVSPKNPLIITSTHRVRFISDMQYQKRGDNWLSITVTAEMVPGDSDDPLAPPERVYDWIIAGSPSTPSPDIIIAGGPSAPSPVGIKASIYKYEVLP